MSQQHEGALTAWDAEADVVIVGFGGAGASAAIQAREDGLEVIAIDRFHGGGATAISGGVFYAGGGTAVQQEAGVTDDVDAMYNYLRMEVKGVVSDATLRDFCESSIENLEWLRSHGVPFEGSLCPVKTSYPTNKYYLYYSGNESFRPWREEATPAPRGHRAKGKGLPGASFYEPLRASAEQLGARTFYETRATSLIRHADGSVAGVEVRRIPPGSAAARTHAKLNASALKWKNYSPAKSKKLWRQCEQLEESHGQIERIRARKGIVLAAGGFVFNREMIEEHAPKYRPGMPLGTHADQGDGIKIGESAGGGTDHMNRVSAWRFINPPMSWTKGIIVNDEGERYVNETLYGAAIGEEMVERNGGKAWLIIDKKLWRASCMDVWFGRAQWFQAAPATLNLFFNARKGKTIEEVAKKARIPAAKLRATVDAYNEQVRTDAPDPFLKDEAYYYELDSGPFYAIDCSITSKIFPCPTLTLGGLKVDETTGAVTTDEGETIEGLYAAGRNAVGICSRQYVSGLSIADCVYSGRRAARSIAAMRE